MKKMIITLVALASVSIYAKQCEDIELNHARVEICAEVTIDNDSKSYTLKDFSPSITHKNYLDLPIMARDQAGKILCELFLKRKYSNVRSSLIKTKEPVLILTSENSGIRVESSTLSFGNAYTITTIEKMFKHVECIY